MADRKDEAEAASPLPAVPGWPLSLRELAAKAELLDLLLAATNDGIVDWNLTTGATAYNPRWKMLLGFEGDALLETPTLWRELTHPEDLLEVEARLRDHLEHHWPFMHTSRMRNAHGGWRWILCRGFALRDPVGDPTRMVITFSDISDRIRAQEQQRALVSAIPDTMFRVHREGLVLDLKIGARDHRALWRGLAVGKSLRDVVADHALVDALLKATRSAAASGKVESFVATSAVGPGISEAHDIRVVASGDDEAVCIVRDITSQRSMEAQLLQSQKLQAIGHLAAGIAHEINTPLQYVGDNLQFGKTAVADLLDLLSFYQGIVHGAGSPIDPAVKAAALAREVDSDLDYLREHLPRGIDRALDGVDRVTRIVRAMKALSHADGAGASKQMASINGIIENTLIVSTSEWRSVAELTTDLDPNLPLVPCSAGNFAQLILDLVVNAAQAIAGVVAGGDKGRITVSTAQKDEHAEIRVHDTGGGIPEAIRSKIFDPFFTTKPVGQGTGQGLAMAHATVAEHQGSISFETEVGKGTTFIVRLPLGANPK